MAERAAVRAGAALATPNPVASMRPANPLHRLGFYFALVLVFLRFSFLLETLAALIGANTYLLYIVGPIALFAVAVSGGLQRTFHERAGKFWLAFMLWMIAAVLFSSWQGGSTAHVFTYIRTDFPMLLVTAGLAATWPDCKKIIYMIGAACVVNVVTSNLFMVTTSGERLALAWGGTIGNSNDLAAHLLLVLPILLFVAIKPGTPKILRLILLAVIGDGLFLILHTGSRGGLIALIVAFLFVLVRGTTRQRLIVAIGGPAALISIVSILPSATWNRLQSFSSDSDHASEEALESRENREYVLRKSIVYTLANPFFGIGPGQFSSYEGGSMTKQGLRGSWHETHNSYTQISSECGIPALIFYIGAMISTFSLLGRIKKRAVNANRDEIVSAVFCLTVGLVAYCAATAFVNFGYFFYFPAISGLVIAMGFAVPQELALSSIAIGIPRNPTRRLF